MYVNAFDVFLAYLFYLNRDTYQVDPDEPINARFFMDFFVTQRP
jgi:hypothetical protein